MASAAFDGGWTFPDNLPGQWKDEHDNDQTSRSSERTSGEPFAQNRQRRPYGQASAANAHESTRSSRQAAQDEPQQRQRQQRHYGPRTCRICLETVLPTFEPYTETMTGMFAGPPPVTYSSPDVGRLIRPCLCKGSQKYVHEGCLAAWRLQDPTNKRNYWQCPTCKYSYRLNRMAWGRWISNTASQITLTFAIFLIAIFGLGFVADPIINLYLDPYTTIASGSTPQPIYRDDYGTWFDHFLKGFASMGLLGFVKFLLTLSPWHWLNMRSGGGMGGMGRTGNTGRDRMAQISWVAVSVGVVTVLWAVWKGVRAWSRRTLEKASERVMDVPLPDDEDDDD